MEVTDLPVLLPGILQLLFQPIELFGVHVVAVENEETDTAFLESVIVCSVHIKKLVEALVRIVVVAQRRVELDAGIQQQLVWYLELLFKIFGAAAAVDVVTEHDHEVEREGLAGI